MMNVCLLVFLGTRRSQYAAKQLLSVAAARPAQTLLDARNNARNRGKNYNYKQDEQDGVG